MKYTYTEKDAFRIRQNKTRLQYNRTHQYNIRYLSNIPIQYKTLIEYTNTI